MLPAGAYVTLEHEYILIVRKGGKRVFSSAADKKRRQESAIFWEERNTLFSDIWTDLKGTVQGLGERGLRQRSAAEQELVNLVLVHPVDVDVLDDRVDGLGSGVGDRHADAADHAQRQAALLEQFDLAVRDADLDPYASADRDSHAHVDRSRIEPAVAVGDCVAEGLRETGPPSDREEALVVSVRS